jgi:hypothetical protein
MLRTGLKSEGHVHLGAHAVILGVRCGRQGSESNYSGENAGAKLQHRKCAHGGFSFWEGVSLTAFTY